MLIPCAILLSLAAEGDPAPSVQRFGSDPQNIAVRVDHASLAHTTQILATEEHCESAREEIESVIDELETSLTSYESTRSDLVKVNIYVDSPETHLAAIDFLLKWCPKTATPAVSSVTSSLPRKRRFGLDAVFVVRRTVGAHNVIHRVAAARSTKVQRAQTSVLPVGDAVYVSGQAQPGELALATRDTLSGLLKTLEFMGLDRSDIVQLKCFLQPMDQVAVVEAEIAKFFDRDVIPAVSYVEWITGGSRPIEIELVAAAPKLRTSETVSYYTPPGMKASPVFSRVARIHGDRRVYVSGLFPAESGSVGSQVDSIFEKLIRTLKPTRANLRHLAKATYYVSDAEVSTELNRRRPHYYDGQRPPAASKATVRGVGVKDRRISIDIIAAPEAPLKSVLTPLAESLRPTRSLVYKTAGDRPLHLHVFEPPGHKSTDRRPVMLAIHGGGWTGGNAATFFPFADYFAKQGFVGISLEYRLRRPAAGTTVFDCVRDARSAVRWIRSNADSLGIDPHRIAVMGGSAGGHLAVSTAMFDAVNDTGDNKDFSARPDALILLYPVIDTSAEGYGQQKIGKRWRELSPVHNAQAGLPPTLILHGTGDAVTPYAGARRFVELSAAAGNECELVTHPGGRHGYLIFDRVLFEDSLSRMRTFLIRHGLDGN